MVLPDRSECSQTVWPEPGGRSCWDPAPHAQSAGASS